MNYLIDIIILLCLGWGAYKGFRKGFIIQSFAIIALILGIWGGFALSDKFEPFLIKNFSIAEPVLPVISFVTIFIFVMLLVYVSGFLVTKMADMVTLGMINRLSGAVFGVLANALILSVIIVLLGSVNEKKQFLSDDDIEKTYFYQPVGKLAPAIFPEKFFKKVKNTFS